LLSDYRQQECCAERASSQAKMEKLLQRTRFQRNAEDAAPLQWEEVNAIVVGSSPPRRIMKEIAMPGGRLTQQERQQIALGLADNLPYAEIARRLDRPTSTITREVMRNNGPTAYRADLAHRATERRAHRRRPASSRGPDPVPQPHGRDARAVADYEETLTTVLMASGLAKMGARVLTVLFTTDAGSLTAPQLAQRLQVSPASISKAIAFLESQSLVRRERDERRRDRYIVDDELFYQATVASARANDQLVETARQGVAVLGADTPAAHRLENIARFLDFISESITRAADQAREILRTRPEASPTDAARHHGVGPG
jgi:DNA-binding transcriptional regulator GbsR (MarR family)